MTPVEVVRDDGELLSVALVRLGHLTNNQFLSAGEPLMNQAGV
jgi:hypothetical protein